MVIRALGFIEHCKSALIILWASHSIVILRQVSRDVWVGQMCHRHYLDSLYSFLGNQLTSCGQLCADRAN